MPSLVKTGSESGAERWAAPDDSVVEFRAPDGATLRFATYRKITFLVKKEIGVRITTTGGLFDAARIDAHYFVKAAGQTYAAHLDADETTNDTYLDEYEWKIMGEFPVAVAALCRAQWRGARFSATVRRGPRVQVAGEPAFPDGYPDTWQTPGGVLVKPTQLHLTSRAAGLTARGSVLIRNREGTALSVTVSAPTSDQFRVETGDVRIPPGGDYYADVVFLPRGAEPATAAFTIVTPEGPRTIALNGDVRQKTPKPS
ncbi:hypothetical protein [Glaciihabitans sp. dw_435]|uniref:hypothetical protein n=1 Tax=Glaciihabitans sp. dw_435 TaxID=2720081 RepID=UPI001BD6A6AD|nr:hypothetical protein [Glaciihabitans sp. dw_435]